MRRFDARRANPEELRLALARPPLDEIAVSPKVAAGVEAVFGPGVTPEEAVRRIIADVEAHGDAAVVEYLEKIDGVKLAPDALYADEEEIEAARRAVRPEELEAIRHACRRIRAFHEAQRERSWFVTGPHGEILGQRVVPIERVGCYVPGGRAPLLSTALMAIVPAKVAGVDHIIAATPPRPDGTANPYVLVAALEAGADRVLKVGGAQAIAALAYGTTWIPKVDKIVGPGNIFVTLAKRAVFGRVGIDALNGPSELAVIADESADPAWVAADLLSQAEHDPEAAAVLFAVGEKVVDAVLVEVEKQLAALPRGEIARESLDRWGAAVICRDLDQACEWLNVLAPEHAELCVKEPFAALHKIRFAGAVFLGPWSTEPVGDYIAGPNHILPTNGTARFSSPLGVYDFVRRSSVIAYTPGALGEVLRDGALLARLEGLEGHARALEAREQGAGLPQEPGGHGEPPGRGMSPKAPEGGRGHDGGA